jgi:hypothetical protein
MRGRCHAGEEGRLKELPGEVQEESEDRDIEFGQIAQVMEQRRSGRESPTAIDLLRMDILMMAQINSPSRYRTRTGNRDFNARRPLVSEWNWMFLATGV